MHSQGLLARSRAMPTPIAPRIILAQNARLELQTLARAHSTPQSLALRARMVLRAAAVEQPTHLQIGHELGCSNLTVGTWRRRYLELGFPGLHDARRSGRPRIIAPPTRVQVISVASALPKDQERPVTRWTLNEIVATLLDALNTEAISHGTRVLINALAVATGQRAWTIGATRKATDFVAHLNEACHRFPGMQRYDWVMDNLNTHWSLDVCRLVARWCKVPFEPQRLNTGPQRRAFLNDPSHRHVFHFTPKHGSWLNQAELFFRVLHRRFLARGSFSSAKDFVRHSERFLKDDNARHAHPYRWTYTGEPLVRY